MSKRERDAGIELLRIILFFMVVALHVVSPYRQSRFDKFEANWQFSGVVATICRLCTNGFVVISGFFYESYLGRRAGKTIVKLLTPLLAVLPFYFVLELTMGAGFGDALAHVFLGVTQSEYYLYHTWYVQVFLALSLIAPLLALGLEAAGRRTHFAAMAVMLVTTSVLPTITYMTGLTWFNLPLFDAKLPLFVALFLVGAYINKYPPEMSAVKAGLLFLGIEAAAVFGNILYNSRYSPAGWGAILKGEVATFLDAAWIERQGLAGAFADPSNIIFVAGAALILVLFTKLPIYSGFVVKVARHSYGAYLIHVFWIQALSRLGGGYFDLYDPKWLDSPVYPVYVICLVLAVGVISLASDALLRAGYRKARAALINRA